MCSAKEYRKILPGLFRFTEPAYFASAMVPEPVDKESFYVPGLSSCELVVGFEHRKQRLTGGAEVAGIQVIARDVLSDCGNGIQAVIVMGKWV